MAQIHSESVVITLNTLTKDSDTNRPVLVSEDLKQALGAVAQELAGAGVIVEITTVTE